LIFVDCGSTLKKEGIYGAILQNKQRPVNRKLAKLFENVTGYGIDYP
jgi:hypothetical protein